jgi:outer membrane protein assembly factor BamB
LVALDVKTGKPLWNDTLARASRSFAISGLATIAASPVISDGVVYATGVGSRTVAINLKTGARLWDISFGSAHTPVAAGNALFLVDLDDNLTAVDRRTGEVLWATHLPVTKTKKKRTHWAGPLLAGNTLWLVSNEGGMIGVEPTSGRVTATRDGLEPAMISPIAVSGKILVLTASGNLTAYE